MGFKLDIWDAALRRIVIRSYSWWNWIYPLPF